MNRKPLPSEEDKITAEVTTEFGVDIKQPEHHYFIESIRTDWFAIGFIIFSIAVSMFYGAVLYKILFL